MSLKELDNLEGEFPGIASEVFSGSLIRDTLGIALDEAPEYIADSITSATSQPVQLHTGHELAVGWNYFAWMMPYEQDIPEAFYQIKGSPIEAWTHAGDQTQHPDIIIVKDYSGNAWVPEWGFNGIGKFRPGAAYQIKLPEGSPFTGSLTFPLKEDQEENFPDYATLIQAINSVKLDIPAGWSFFGYNRLTSLDTKETFGGKMTYSTDAAGNDVVTNADITDKIVIIKDNEGNAYFVEWNFTWGDMTYLTPGQGYQIKTTEALYNVQFPAEINLGIPLIDQ